MAQAPPTAMMMGGGLAANLSNRNAASSAKWAERPVERLAPASQVRYEEEEDPEMACYLWDRNAQKPKRDQRPAQAPPRQGAAFGPALGKSSQPPPPPPQRQKQLLTKVCDMGFDEPTARRALVATGWAGVEEAVGMLLG